MRVLFVAALAEESEALEASGAAVLHVGVGKVQAATALAHHLVRHADDIDLVVNVGTAGALGRQTLGEVHEVTTVHQHDFDHHGLSAFVGRPLPGGPIQLPGPSDAVARLATGDRLVLEDGERDRLARDADLVDMEGYAVAATCRQFGMPVWLVKAVSDNADGDTTMAFHQTLDVCSRRLAAWARERGLLDDPGPRPRRGH
jgi:adenosylhomocysteine nucleosidase